MEEKKWKWHTKNENEDLRNASEASKKEEPEEPEEPAIWRKGIYFPN